MSIQLWERPAKRTCFSCICFVAVMSLENPGACGDSSSTGDINRNIRELLLEVRNQRSEINSPNEEVRGASQSVASEVKKIKSGNDIRWRFDGNRLQFEFNSEVADNLKQTLLGLENGKQEYAVEVLKESCDKLKTRNKHIRIADSSEGGWETVRQYISNPLASDSEDETRLSRAESRAVKKKKTQQKPKPKSKQSFCCLWLYWFSQSAFVSSKNSVTNSWAADWFLSWIPSRSTQYLQRQTMFCLRRTKSHPPHMSIHQGCSAAAIRRHRQEMRQIQRGILLILKMSIFLLVMILIVIDLLKIILSMNGVRKI